MTSSEPARIAAYGFNRPDAAEARASLVRVFGAQAAPVWTSLLRDAGLERVGVLDVDAEFGRLVDAFLRSPDPVVGLCGQALRIRQQTFQHLSTTHDVMETSS